MNYIITVFNIIYAIAASMTILYFMSPETFTKFRDIVFMVPNPPKKKTINKKNKFTDLNLFDFEKYLTSVLVGILGSIIELHISQNDPNNVKELQLRGFVEFLKYFDDILPHITSLYGPSYMKNFYDLTYDRLRLSGEINRFISNKGIK